MSVLQVANIHLESTQNNRIQYTGSNTVTVYAGGVGTVVVNSTSLGGLSGLSVGNSTANVVSNTTMLQVANSTGTANLQPTQLIVGTTTINSTVVNAASVYDSGALVLTASQADQQITGGARVTVNDLGNVSGTTVTPDPGDRPMQKVTNNGTWTLAPGSNFGNYILDIVNTTGAQIPTTSGWTKVSGDSLDATTTSKFRCFCSVTGDFSLLNITKVV